MSENPYSPLPSNQELGAMQDASGDKLAGRLTRFGAALLDGLAMMVVIFPIQMVTGYFARVQAQEVGVVEQLVMSLVGIVVMLVINGYLLLTKGQTVGKLLLGIQIVDQETGNLLPFLRVFVFRYLWTLPLTLITALIPGPFDDSIVGLVSLVDVLLIFGASQRCLHDYIAGSKVVEFKAGRTVSA